MSQLLSWGFSTWIRRLRYQVAFPQPKPSAVVAEEGSDSVTRYRRDESKQYAARQDLSPWGSGESSLRACSGTNFQVVIRPRFGRGALSIHEPIVTDPKPFAIMALNA